MFYNFIFYKTYYNLYPLLDQWQMKDFQLGVMWENAGSDNPAE